MSLLPAAAVVGRQDVDEALRAAVDRFFATQQQENVEAYLALWSAKTNRPSPQMLKYVFDSGDDEFADIEIVRVIPSGERVRVRVSATRRRTARPREEGATATTRETRMLVSLTYVREDGEWKLWREGQASDDLADALLESTSGAGRADLLAAEPELLDERLPLAIARRAASLAQQGQYAAAQAAYQCMLEVARHIGDRRYEAEALQNLGNTFYFQRNLTAALDAYEQRLAIERERGDQSGIAGALSGIATIRYSFAEYSAALAAYREALAIQERLGEDALVATSLISTGNVLYLQGDFEAAIADYARSRELSRRVVNPQGEARALEGLGRVFLARGDFVAALEAFGGVLQDAAARGDRRGQGNATLNIGETHFRLGNLDLARRTFEESKGHFEASKDAATVGRLWQAIALTDLAAARFPQAEEEYVKSGASCGAAGDRECVAGATAGLAFALTAQDKFVDAIASYRKAVEQFAALNRAEHVARTRIGLAHALAGHGDHEAALDASIEAGRAGAALGNDDVVWRALVSKAHALRRLDRPDSALEAALAAEEALHRLIETSRTRPAQPVARESTAVLATLAILHAERGDAIAAFDAAERMRAHDLRLSLAGAEREIARGMTVVERDEERAIFVELVSLQAQLAREKGLPRPDTDRLRTLEQRVADAALRRAGQQQRLFERLPDLRVWRGLMDPVAGSDVAPVLATGDMIVQFVVDDRDVLVVLATRTDESVEFSADVRRVTRQALSDRIARLVQPDVLRSRSEWREGSAEFLNVLLRASDLAAIQQATRLFVVPHESLWRVPFEALPVKDRWLTDITRLAYVPSITGLVRVPSRSDAMPGSRMTLTLAAPEIAASVRARVEQTAPGWVLRDPASAIGEVTVIRSDTPEDRQIALSGADAHEAAVRERLPEAGIIHVALPFRINGASPLFSPLLLSGEPAGHPPDPLADGKLEVREIMNLTLGARAAILSDPAAIAMRDTAQDAAIVQWAWRAAGVRWLMMPRWSAGPDAAGGILAGVHRRLRDGQAADDALHEAQAAVRHTESWNAPFYWAGWLLIGGR